MAEPPLTGSIRGRPPSRDAGAGLHARQPAAVHSALTVLEAVAQHGAGVNAREISVSLGLPRATAYRLLNLLVQDGYLVRTPDLSGFALGSKVVQFARALQPPALPRAVRDVVRELRSGIRGGVHLVHYDETRVILSDVDPDFPLSDPARITRELDASAIGRLLLGELGYEGYPSWTVSKPASAVRDLIAETIAAGHASQIGELVAGAGCLALPIRDDAGRLVAGLAISAPMPRIEEPEILLRTLHLAIDRLAPLLA